MHDDSGAVTHGYWSLFSSCYARWWRGCHTLLLKPLFTLFQQLCKMMAEISHTVTKAYFSAVMQDNGRATTHCYWSLFFSSYVRWWRSYHALLLKLIFHLLCRIMAGLPHTVIQALFPVVMQDDNGAAIHCNSSSFYSCCTWRWRHCHSL